MIRYNLKCANTHDFESWFKSADAYEALRNAGHISCPICGDASVEKTLMAPAVRSGRQTEAAEQTDDGTAEREKAIQLLKEQIEANSEYVGMNFVAEVRKMHQGDTPERSIYGEAKPEEAKKLLEDGVPVTPLPFLPKRKTN